MSESYYKITILIYQYTFIKYSVKIRRLILYDCIHTHFYTCFYILSYAPSCSNMSERHVS